MSQSITLSSATRQNLLSLQDTATLTATTQGRLATGLKVSSALDNPVNFFTAQSFTSRSGDLSALLDSISNGIQTIQAANQGITSIQKLIDSAKSIVSQALATQITTTGTASVDYSGAVAGSGASTDFYINGDPKHIILSGIDTIDQSIEKLNIAAGVVIFSKDASGTRISLNASADIEFADPSDQTQLGFAGGTAPVGPYYGTGFEKAGQSSDLTVTGVSTRKSLSDQYNDLLTQIDQLAKDASYNGVNLLSSAAPTNKLHISFNEKDTSNLDVQGVDATSVGLKLSAITSTSNSAAVANNTNRGNFLLDADVKATTNQLIAATDAQRANASNFGSNLSVVQNRQDFTKHLINILDTGSVNLTNADLNAEAANSQVLSTRQSLGISALSLASQAQQGILQLLR
ncbi:flagellar protein [Methylobacterium gnaphalii]|uniref:Flagellin N-terminal domain-containing protein n=1 Tax=Methylobacterium gnaphalii TaxID=1010610 RepID=A0A512JRL0_9HYPH|nr:flagellar protein [Methylobacterium gnaphalii]GEP12596.1 hypothetical protein MGN01_44410 [Methylobacterium gnaphalii]GJD70539.1 hypothetical protein MMMDOFMJ_3488 [Methylobacterium gnaphalii]GLS48447.1 hypothetical protein GCM10007885_12910 [Methylobacterium gnaphalii]